MQRLSGSSVAGPGFISCRLYDIVENSLQTLPAAEKNRTCPQWVFCCYRTFFSANLFRNPSLNGA
jgi:hypothetical protein